jgi:hypothetical protein
MKNALAILIAILAGFGLGWYFGYTRPSLKNQRELLRQYQYVRDNFHMTDAEMADFGEHQQEYFDALKRTDELAAAIALGALRRLNHGNTDGTRHVLESTISTYYRGHRTDGNTNLLHGIDSFAATNASLSYAIHRPLE